MGNLGLTYLRSRSRILSETTVHHKITPKGIFFITLLHSPVQKPHICSDIVHTLGSKPSLAFNKRILSGNTPWEFHFAGIIALEWFVCAPDFCRVPVLNIPHVYSYS